MRAVSKQFASSALSMVVISVLFSACAVAQMNGVNGSHAGSAFHGVPPSVTSFGFGGHPGFHGVAPSVTSPGFGNSFRLHSRPVGVHRHRRGFTTPFYGGIYAAPYAYPYDDYADYPGVDDSMEQEDYRGGPTIFDRRGPGSAPENDYRAESNSGRQMAPRDEPAEPAADQPQTVLIFKDGRQVEVSNYAILGTTLYDLSEGRTRKVALAELDLPATVKENDQRGVEFQLPASVKLN